MTKADAEDDLEALDALESEAKEFDKVSSVTMAFEMTSQDLFS